MVEGQGLRIKPPGMEIIDTHSLVDEVVIELGCTGTLGSRFDDTHWLNRSAGHFDGAMRSMVQLERQTPLYWPRRPLP